MRPHWRHTRFTEKEWRSRANLNMAFMSDSPRFRF